jgi:hypothetical protein
MQTLFRNNHNLKLPINTEEFKLEKNFGLEYITCIEEDGSSKLGVVIRSNILSITGQKTIFHFDNAISDI